MMDSIEIHNALVRLGYTMEKGKNELIKTFEFCLGNSIYVYVKRRGNEKVKKAPLVIHPDSIKNRVTIDAIDGIGIAWEKRPTISTGYRNFPKVERNPHGTVSHTQHGYAVEIASEEALKRLILVLALKGNAEIQSLSKPEEEKVETHMNNAPLNQILYGPPGTGKTFHTVERAVNIISPSFSGTREQYKKEYDRLVATKQIRFVTFHQSFSYEDFVEGIRPETGEGDKLTYPVQNGVFKEIVIDAQSSRCSNSNENVQYNPKNIWKMSLGDTQSADAYIYDECIKNNYILLGYGDDIDFTACKGRKAILDKFKGLDYQGDDLKYPVTAVNMFTTTMQIGDLVIISDGNFKFRAIGRITGNYEFIENDERDAYRQCRSVEWLKVYETSLPRQRIIDVGFSQMTLYRPSPSALDRNKLFSLLQNEPGESISDSEQYVLIIDEINRGNISRIFGELITLLEDDKREGTANAQSIILPYSKDSFIIPKNLHILGTMNTADRSLAGIDIALRRRFQFEEMLPRPDLLTSVQIDGINLAEVLSVMNERIEVLLGRDYVIGHSYFINLKSSDNLEESGLPNIFKNKIIPLLQEYFYEDWERIQWVLNDHRKNNKSHKFIRKSSDFGKGRNFQDLFGTELDLPDTTDKRWTINQEAFANAQSYVQIYETASKSQLSAASSNAE